MPQRRIYFDWSTVTRDYLFGILWESSVDIVGQKLPASKIFKILSSRIKHNQLPIKFSKKSSPEVEHGLLYLGGAYYSDYDRKKLPSIEVSVYYNPLDEHVCFTKTRFKNLCLLFADVILHEIIHMRQYRRRKFKSIPDYESYAENDQIRKDQEYFGCKDEIDAYGFNIACELLDKFKTEEEVINYLGKQHRKGRLKSNCLRLYLKAFTYDNNHPIIRRLKKRITRYLSNARLGKPYKSPDWINY